MKTYIFTYIDSDNNDILVKEFDCFDEKEAANLAERLFAETMQIDCVAVIFKEA